MFHVSSFMFQERRGFTLMEVLIYTALLATFLAGSFAFVMSSLQTTDIAYKRNEVLANQEFVERKLKWILGQATRITTPGANASSTQLRAEGGATSTFPAHFRLEGGAITLSIASSATVALTNNRVSVNQFVVNHYSNAQSTSTARVLITIQSLVTPKIKASSTIFHVLQ